jgi:hypothetical protein
MPASIRFALSTLAVSATAAFAQFPRSEGPIQHHGAVGFIAPAGWTAQQGRNGATILTHQVDRDMQPCQIMLLPPAPAQGDLGTMGVSMVQEFANAQRLGQYKDENGRDPRLSREEGVSGSGWPFVDLQGQLGSSGITARVLMIQMSDGQVLPIVGFSRHYLCLGSMYVRDNDIWSLLFYSLQIPGYTQESPKNAEQIVGMWTSVGGNAGNAEIFAPNGHFSTVGVYRSYEASSSPGYVWEVDRSWMGDGPYEAHGNLLHTQNLHASEAERDVTRYFSVVRMPNESKPGGYDYVLLTLRHGDNGPVWGFSNSGNYVSHEVRQSDKAH